MFRKKIEDSCRFQIEPLVRAVNMIQSGNKVLIVGAADVLKYLAKKENLEIEAIYTLEPLQVLIAFGKKNVTTDEVNLFNKTILALKKKCFLV